MFSLIPFIFLTSVCLTLFVIVYLFTCLLHTLLPWIPLFSFSTFVLYRFPSFHFLYLFQGLISTLVALDRETRTSHVFTVQATDNGQTPLRGYTSVSCFVTQDLSLVQLSLEIKSSIAIICNS